MSRDHSLHLSDTTLEAYALGTLTDESQLAACEEHLLICHDCQNRAGAWDGYVATIKAALEQSGTYFVHRTEDGPILIIPRGSGARWEAAVEGLEISAGATGRSSKTAMRKAEEVFQQMFPEHQCTVDCGWRMREGQSV
jgi:hypothetical protein